MTEVVVRATDFLARFNGPDLEAVVTEFSADAVYHDPHGGKHKGRSAIREALRPIFDGALGQVNYAVRDIVADAGRVVATWTLSMTADDGTVSTLDGVDLLTYVDGSLADKRCYVRPMES